MINHELKFLKALAHEIRWQVVQTLAVGDRRVHELVDITERPLNVVSSHLKKLRDANVVTVRRSEADGRDLYYALNLSEVQQRFLNIGRVLLPATADAPATVGPMRVLFVCTHNSARSQMAEGLMRRAAGSWVDVFSAGSDPTDIHPDGVKVLQARGVDISGQQSQPLAAFSGQSFDYVITVCDRAREMCPMFPGKSQQIHWGYPDPVTITNDAERLAAFDTLAAGLEKRIDNFLKMLPVIHTTSFTTWSNLHS
jgi:ArsR family transcriptional regulator, arsenate/arsenite/antimonite-responsive transcriptional repressor / arsenate reductase (thioredoxin)